MYRKYVCMKSVKPNAYDCVQEGKGGSNFGDFCA